MLLVGDRRGTKIGLPSFAQAGSHEPLFRRVHGTHQRVLVGAAMEGNATLFAREATWKMSDGRSSIERGHTVCSYELDTCGPSELERPTPEDGLVILVEHESIALLNEGNAGSPIRITYW
jgi:hypothetical protein